MDYTVSITDTNQLAGITKAREMFNQGKASVEQLSTDGAYVQMLVERAAQSYAEQYVMPPKTMTEAMAKLRELEGQKAAAEGREKAERDAKEAALAREAALLAEKTAAAAATRQ